MRLKLVVINFPNQIVGIKFNCFQTLKIKFNQAKYREIWGKIRLGFTVSEFQKYNFIIM